MNDDGYPTDETLEVIKNWDDLSYRGQLKLLNHVKDAWSYPTRVGVQAVNVIMYWFSTGGWSGNEGLIDALRENTMFWMLCWHLSRRGGYYEFIPRKVSDD